MPSDAISTVLDDINQFSMPWHSVLQCILIQLFVHITTCTVHLTKHAIYIYIYIYIIYIYRNTHGNNTSLCVCVIHSALPQKTNRSYTYIYLLLCLSKTTNCYVNSKIKNVKPVNMSIMGRWPVYGISCPLQQINNPILNLHFTCSLAYF